MTSDRKKLTIFMYPWFAMGHITPYLLTANKFAERGHKVFLTIPPKAGSKLTPLISHPGLVELRPISIPHVEGLPAHVETTNDVTIQQQDPLRRALHLTQPVIQSLLCELKPDYVFFDSMHWLPGLARRLGIRSVHYSVVSPAAMGFLFPGGPSDEDLVTGPPGFPASIKIDKHNAALLKLFATVKEISGLTIQQRFITAICDSDAIGFKTCRETEEEFCKFLENKLKKPILLSGPMIPKQSTDLILDGKWADWLDKFEPKTVIFCAFGSEAVLNMDQFEQLLLGIEQTAIPFLIALRPPLGVDAIEEALPKGFKERNGGKGIVHGGWVPQQLILKHPAIGCFMTHCGYGSMWEGLMSECRLVALPFVADQHVHARLLSGVLKVAVEVRKGDEDGVFTKEGVHEAITAAMAEDGGIGEEVRGNHGKLREVLLSEGFEDSYFDGFVDKLHNFLELSS